jgi:hypothetical protein
MVESLLWDPVLFSSLVIILSPDLSETLFNFSLILVFLLDVIYSTILVVFKEEVYLTYYKSHFIPD